MRITRAEYIAEVRLRWTAIGCAVVVGVRGLVSGVGAAAGVDRWNKR